MAVLKCTDPKHGQRNPNIPGNEHLAGHWVTVLGKVENARRPPEGIICHACLLENTAEREANPEPDNPLNPKKQAEKIAELEARLAALEGN